MDDPRGEGAQRGAHDYTLSSVRSAARLLCAFTLAEPELGLSELARRLGLGKSRVHRLLATLVSEHLIEQNPLTGKYRLSIKLYELGAIVSTHLDLREAVAEHIDELRDRTGETVHVAILDGDEVVYVERRESPNTLRLSTHIGHRDHAHSTSTGKVLLAHLPERELGRMLARTDLVARTPHTITDPGRLRTELEGVRRRGWAENVNESDLGVASIAAPVRDASGQVVAAISVAGPHPRFTPEATRRITQEVIATAERISARLGHHRGDTARLRALSGR